LDLFLNIQINAYTLLKVVHAISGNKKSRYCHTGSMK